MRWLLGLVQQDVQMWLPIVFLSESCWEYPEQVCVSLMEVINNLAGAGWVEEEVAECVSQLPPEERPSLQRCCLQKRIRTCRAASPRLPRPVHPAVWDHSVVRSPAAVAPETTADVLVAHTPWPVKPGEKNKKAKCISVKCIEDVQCML